MRKKVAILLPWLKMGGTNKVALRFIKELVEFCDVTLVLSCNTGELINDVPSDVAMIVDEMRPFKELFLEDVRHVKIGFIIRDVIYYLKVKLKHDGIDNYRYIVKRHRFISNDMYDCAISYHGQSPERLLNLVYRIHARKKVAWIHGEMSFSAKDCDKMKKYYSALDHFFFVSEPTMCSFQRRINIEATRCTVYYNPIETDEIIQLSKAPIDNAFDTDRINLLTVGRISAEKGQDMIPEITRRLIDSGYRICWYIIGDGDMRNELKTKIKENKVDNEVILLGTKINPYPYMKACDIYVQPSYTEGYSTTICEAGILGKAIIGTKPSGGIREQIADKKDGLIVDASKDGLLDGIVTLIENEGLRHSFEREIRKKNFSGKGEISKFLNYLESEG